MFREFPASRNLLGRCDSYLFGGKTCDISLTRMLADYHVNRILSLQGLFATCDARAVAR